MSGSTLRQTVRVINPLGFHMRPKMRFAELAMQCASTVTVIWEGKRYNGKSMWDLMLVAAEQGQDVTVEAEGPDAGEALPALVAVLAAPGTEDGGAAPEGGG